MSAIVWRSRHDAGDSRSQDAGAGSRRLATGNQEGLRPGVRIAVAFLVPAATSLLPFLGLGGLTAPAFMVLTLVSAVWLRRAAPAAWLVFIISVWMTAPIFRRLADWSTGTFSEQSLALYVPAVVTALGVASAGMTGLRRRERDGAWLVAFAVTLGAVVGAFNVGIRPAVFGAAEWLIGPAVACCAYAVLRRTPELKSKIVDGLAALTLVVSAYGLYQFWFLPAWDQFWLANAPIDSQGSAVAGELRIFSTTNSTGVFALGLAFLVLILVCNYRVAYLPPLILSSLALALTLVRASWLVVLIGVVLLLVSGRRQKLFSLVVAVGASALLLVYLPSFSGGLSSTVQTSLTGRIASFSTLSGDKSFQGREGFTQRALDLVANNPLGYGLGTSGAAARSSTGPQAAISISDFDNGWVNVPYTLGWIGALSYLVGLVFLLGGAGGAAVVRFGAVATGLLFVNVLVSAVGAVVAVFCILVAIEAGDMRGDRLVEIVDNNLQPDKRISGPPVHPDPRGRGLASLE